MVQTAHSLLTGLPAWHITSAAFIQRLTVWSITA